MESAGRQRRRGDDAIGPRREEPAGPPEAEGHQIQQYLGLVSGEVIIGANFIKDFTASLHDFFGGRSSSYEQTLIEAKEAALKEMSERAARLGANAIVGIDLDYEAIGAKGSMLMVSCSGTAVKI